MTLNGNGRHWPLHTAGKTQLGLTVAACAAGAAHPVLFVTAKVGSGFDGGLKSQIWNMTRLTTQHGKD